MFCKKSVFKNVVKVTGKNLCRTRTQVFSCQFLQIFQEHLIYWTPLVVASSNFKVSGFAEAQIHDLVHLTVFSSSCHFWVYFWQAQAFHRLLSDDITFLICHVTTISNCHMTLWVGSCHSKSTPWGSIGLMELEIKAFVISVPFLIPIPMSRFQCQGLQMALSKINLV